MTLERAHELIAARLTFGGCYNRNSARLIVAEIQREHGQAGVDPLTREPDLEPSFGRKPGTDFSKATR
jgi:hypothetical protein